MSQKKTVAQLTKLGWQEVTVLHRTTEPDSIGRTNHDLALVLPDGRVIGMRVWGTGAITLVPSEDAFKTET